MIKSSNILIKRLFLDTNKRILFNQKNININLNKFSKYSFSRSDIPLSNQDIKKKLKDKWEKKHGLMGGMPNLFSNKDIKMVI